MTALSPETPKARPHKELKPMITDPKEKSRTVDLAIAQIEKQFGKGSIMKLGAKDFQQEIPVISTTSLSIDTALGIGGVPRGRVIEIFGPESSGKTTQALHKLTGVVSRSKTCLIFINQIREKIGVMFGNPETTSGGRALKFYASVRLDIRRIAQIKDGDVDIGSRTRVKVVKNKTAPPFKIAEFDILYGTGISRVGDLIDLAITHKLIYKTGAWFSYGETRLGQGRENVRQFLEQNPDLRSEIEMKLRRLLGLIKEPKTPADPKGDGREAAKAETRESVRPPGAKDLPARDIPKPRGHSPSARP